MATYHMKVMACEQFNQQHDQPLTPADLVHHTLHEVVWDSLQSVIAPDWPAA